MESTPILEPSVNLWFQNKELYTHQRVVQHFEEDMINIIQNIKFKDIKCQFQNGLNQDIKSVKNDNGLFDKANKSTNFYKLETTKDNQLLEANITKTYKKAYKNQLPKIDAEAKAVTKKLEIDNQVEATTTKEALLH